MKGYIEEGGLAVCTYDLSGTPQKLVRDDTKRHVTVATKKGKAPLLTVVDKGVMAQFTCKSPAKFWGGLATLVAGIAIGALLIASGPVGWFIAGALAASAAFGIVAVVRAHHVCNSALEISPDWTFPHDKTIIDKHKAILYNQSLLNCKQGGVLIASANPPSANELAKKIAVNNNREISAHYISQLAIGVLTGYTGGKTALLQAMNTSLTVGVYSYGESRTDLSAEKGAGLSAILAGFKGWSYDKYAVLIPGSMANKTLKDMFKEWTGGLGLAAIGIGIDYASNKFEEHFADENNDIRKEILSQENNASVDKIYSTIY